MKALPCNHFQSSTKFDFEFYVCGRNVFVDLSWLHNKIPIQRNESSRRSMWESTGCHNKNWGFLKGDQNSKSLPIVFRCLCFYEFQIRLGYNGLFKGHYFDTLVLCLILAWHYNTCTTRHSWSLLWARYTICICSYCWTIWKIYKRFIHAYQTQRDQRNRKRPNFLWHWKAGFLLE